MKTATVGKEVLLLACMAAAALASGATPAPAIETLDEIDVTGIKERERQRGPGQLVPMHGFSVGIQRKDGITRIQLTLAGILQPEVSFRRQSAARQLAPETAFSREPGHAARLSGDRVIVIGEKSLSTVLLTLDANVDEADGLPASIPFGAHVSLVNLDHARVRMSQAGSILHVGNGIHPQTRRCEAGFTLLDDGLDSPNRFVLLADSPADCRHVERSRQGDLLFADGVPARLRQAVREVYDPIAGRVANRLGSEPGQVFVAWWPQSPHEGFRFERSWNRNSLLLFNGTGWQQGFDAQQREALRTTFTTEQIQRRVRQADWPGVFTESAASYLDALFVAEQSGNTSRWLAEELPGWIAGCASHLRDGTGGTASATDLSGLECGLVVQFVYDAVARAKSAGRDSLYDTWRPLLNASYRRGESGARPAAFLASSEDARRIVQGLLDGTVDWARFATELDGLGVRLRLNQAAPAITVSVLSLTHFKD